MSLNKIRLRCSHTQDKDNVGCGLFTLMAFVDTTQGLRQVGTIRPYWGHLRRMKVMGSRWRDKVYTSHEIARLFGLGIDQCGNLTNYLAYCGTLAWIFDHVLYRQGLKAQYEALDSRGASVNLGTIKLLAYQLAGRRGFTLRRGDGHVGFICAADGGGMGLWSSNVSLRAARAILDEAVLHWPAQLVADREVSLG